MFIKDHNKTALVYGDEKISYRELIDKIEDYSLYLKSMKKKKIAIFFENRPEWEYIFFAGWNVGATVVLIDMMSSPSEVTHILNDCKPSAIFASNKNIDVLKTALKKVKAKPKVENIDKLKVAKRKQPVKSHEPEDNEVILMLYTSGTTGKSKGVMLTKHNIYKNVAWNNVPKRINETDILIQILPCHHSWPLVSTVLCPLDCGATVVILKDLKADVLLKTIKDNKVTMVTAVPRLFEMLHKGIMDKIEKSLIARIFLSVSKFLYRIPLNRYILGRVKFPNNNVIDVIPLTRKIFKKVHDEFGGNIKTFISGGAKLNSDLIDDFRAMGIIMLEGFGLTETAPMITYHPFDELKKGSAGKIFEEMDYRIEDDGELVVKGPNVFKGYYNKPKETKEAFTDDGFFKTGDLAIVDKNRYLYITGRKKDLIVLPNGKNIRPDLIEQHIKNKFKLVEDIAITDIKGKLFAVIVPESKEVRKAANDDINELFKWEVFQIYNAEVENYKKIQNFVITNEELPKTRMGKLQRYKLQTFITDNATVKKKEKVDIPADKEYILISDYLKAVTGTVIHPNDHVEIDLGLDSLSIMELQLFLELTFGMNFADGEIFNYPTVMELFLHIKSNKTKAKKENINWKEILNEDIDWKMPKKIWMMNFLNLQFKILSLFKLKIKSSGVENIPDGPCIFAPNHASYLDSIVLYSNLTRKHKNETYFFAKDKNFKNAFTRFFANRSHVILMDINSDLQLSLKKISQVLKNGKKIVIFPEGTRTKTGELSSFKKTFATIAKELNVPISPVAIKGAFEAMPYTAKFPSKGNILIKFLPTIYPEKYSDSKIAKLVQTRISEVL
ncbi:MAG: AMP-binding protein [Spirochaetes bacterium]|nr:AMP-binding protein [Spirochaetota bacterium]MBN2771012.1 AMP-binding protein [Spirochaetota bacterium]